MMIEKDWWKLEPKDDDLCDEIWSCDEDEDEEEEEDEGEMTDKEEAKEKERLLANPASEKIERDGAGMTAEEKDDEDYQETAWSTRIWMQGIHYESKKKHVEGGGTRESWKH